jgi:hypothetical protein
VCERWVYVWKKRQLVVDAQAAHPGSSPAQAQLVLYICAVTVSAKGVCA